MKLGAHKLRKLNDASGQKIQKEIKPHPIFIVLENVVDTYNVGGFFRLADAVAAEKLYLCGQTQTPPDKKILKASVGTYRLVPWEYKENVDISVAELRKIKNMNVIAVEQNRKAINYTKVKYSFPIAFIFGNETFGMTPSALKLADAIVEIPLYGVNKSLNVMIAAGIVLYRTLEQADAYKLTLSGSKKMHA